ncbi:hypothetical protein [Maricaulis sp.]|uniref:hypothetical protein n=1 Tax=Maricaulis sp. TaxID=1486257 RepID=UPI003A946017
MILLAALALMLDPPCWADEAWPCEFIAPATAADQVLPEGGVPVVYSVSRQGYPYGVHANITDHDAAVAIEAAVQQWTFAPGHAREDVVIVLEHKNGMWIAPWEADCPVPAPIPLVRVEPQLPCLAGGCEAADLERVFSTEALVRYDILPSGETRIVEATADNSLVETSVVRAVDRWFFQPHQACLGAMASFVFQSTDE